MRATLRLVLAGVPGLLLAGAAVFGCAPTERDLPTYFVPLRARTAAVMAGSRGAFWDPDVGCGEPFFANPQSVLLYPPAWFGTILPPAAGVGAEAGLHLALLGIGCALLARRLGAGGWLDVAAGLAVVVAGPVLDAVGVLNNLDALAWMPWVWWAALEGRVALVAAFTALGYLAAEPQLAAIAGVVALTLAPRRRTLAALALAVGLVAVQAVPFGFWVRGGDRGHLEDPLEGMAGVVLPGELTAMAVPGAALPQRMGGRFVADFTVPLWATVLGLVALADRRPAVRTLAVWSAALVVLSVMPSFHWGLTVWNTMTAGMVRYSGRLLFPAVVAMVPAAAAAVGQRRVPRWAGPALAGVALLGGVAAGGTPWAVALAAVSTGAVLSSFLVAPAALVGAAAVAPFSFPALGLEPVRPRPAVRCAAAQRGPGRVYAVAPSWAQLSWIGVERRQRMADLGWGYTPLQDGRRMVRTFAPLTARPVAAQLAEADRGPAGRWWLDAFAADRVVAQHPIPGFTPLCREGGLYVFSNPGAWPESMVVCAMPHPVEQPRACGEVLAVEGRDGWRRWKVRVAPPGGLLLWLETPDPGWRFRVDGDPAEAVQGAGILHGVPVHAGDHEVAARYRPPGLPAGAAISLVSLSVLGVAAWRRW
jgi:hypothetical protein